jgi:hypothetical protein
MRGVATALITSLGVAAFVGGVCSLAYGLMHPGPTMVSGLGPFDGLWPAENYCFLGGVLAAAGSGLATFGVMTKGRERTN